MTHQAAARKLLIVPVKPNRSCREITWATSDLPRRADAPAAADVISDEAQKKGKHELMHELELNSDKYRP